MRAVEIFSWHSLLLKIYMYKCSDLYSCQFGFCRVKQLQMWRQTHSIHPYVLQPGIFVNCPCSISKTSSNIGKNTDFLTSKAVSRSISAAQCDYIANQMSGHQDLCWFYIVHHPLVYGRLRRCPPNIYFELSSSVAYTDLYWMHNITDGSY